MADFKLVVDHKFVNNYFNDQGDVKLMNKVFCNHVDKCFYIKKIKQFGFRKARNF